MIMKTLIYDLAWYKSNYKEINKFPPKTAKFLECKLTADWYELEIFYTICKPGIRYYFKIVSNYNK